MQVLLFLSVMKQKDDNYSSIDFYNNKKFQSYKKKLFVISQKINIWHDQANIKKKGEFDNDSDFVNINSSPDFFQSSSDEFEEED